MIVIKNRQRKVPVPVAQVQHDAAAILKKLHYADFDLSIIITTDRTIRHYNKTYRHKDTATDILSFPFHHDLIPGRKIVVASDDERVLGDLIISPAYIMRHLPSYGVSFEQRLRTLLVHGVYHLLGYDHMTDEDYRVMQRCETRMINHLNKLLPLS